LVIDPVKAHSTLNNVIQNSLQVQSGILLDLLPPCNMLIFIVASKTIYLLSCLGSSVKRRNHLPRPFECYALSAYANKSFVKSAIYEGMVYVVLILDSGVNRQLMESSTSGSRGKIYKFSLYIYTH
jgi:hypothetical protein